MSHVIGRGRYARETYPTRAGGAGGGNVKTQQAPVDDFIPGIASVSLVPINDAPSSPPGQFPPIAIDVTPGNKVVCSFVIQGYGTNSPNSQPSFAIEAEDGSGNGFALRCFQQPRPPSSTAFPDGDSGQQTIAVLVCEYIAQEADQTVRCSWSSGNTGGFWRGIVNQSFHLTVEEVPVPAP